MNQIAPQGFAIAQQPCEPKTSGHACTWLAWTKLRSYLTIWTAGIERSFDALLSQDHFL
jgi:hypothetical protein